MNFGCAILKTGILQRLTASGRRTAILRVCGMVAVPCTDKPFDVDHDMSEDTRITVVSAFNGVEVWFGFSIGRIIEAMIAAPLDLPRFEGLFVAQHTGSGTYLHQYVRAGRYGPGGMIPTARNTAWHRTFRQEDVPIPRSPALDDGVTTLARDPGAPRDLVQRAFTGLSGKGFYGLAWHPDKKEWTMARSLAERPEGEATHLQGLNPNTYAKRGKPFARATHPGPGDGFLTQAAVFQEIQHRAIAFHLGVRLDTNAALDRLFSLPCSRWEVRFATG